jgi:two-component system CheB/CheR fusion protein
MAEQTNTAEFHRQLRGLFAVLRILVRQTTQGRESIQDYAAHLEGRIGALAAAHEMLMRAPREGVDFQEIVHAALLAQSVVEHQYQVAGPEIRIARDSAAALALAFHELTMNAQEYGALTREAGRIEVTWNSFIENGDDWLNVYWREHGAALGTATPRRRGFGSELIERMLPYELGARTSLEWAEDGIRVRLLIPARAGVPVWRAVQDKTA